MSYNLLRDLPRSGFLGLDTLETLDLSYNDLRKINEKTFESMRWLTNLKVRLLCRTMSYTKFPQSRNHYD